MAIGAAIPLLAGAGRIAMTRLPLLMGAGAAIPSLTQGRPIEAAIQGGLGYLTGGALGGPARGLVMAGTRKLPQIAGAVAPKLAEKLTPAALRNLGYGVAGLGVGGGALALGGALNSAAAPVARTVQQGAGNVGQVGAGLAATQRPGPSIYGGDPYDQGLLGNYGGAGPLGSPLDILGERGLGLTAEAKRQAAASLDAQKGFNQENYVLNEAVRKQEMARQMAAAGIRQNIATRAAMLQNAQTGAINMGQQAMKNSGDILTSNFQYQ
jgi:hypothetical protein